MVEVLYDNIKPNRAYTSPYSNNNDNDDDNDDNDNDDCHEEITYLVILTFIVEEH